jgi:hypothetical protein
MKRICAFLFVAALAVQAQPALSNADVIKLAKSGLSDDFILNLVDTQGSRLASDAPSLIEMKSGGVNERILAGIVKKSPSPEKLNSGSILSLVKAGFSDSFVLDLMNRQPSTYALDTARIVELRTGGVSERVLSAMVGQSGGRELASGSAISIRTIDSIDSERAKEGDEFRASLEDPITIGNTVVAPKGTDAKVRLVSEKESGRLAGKAELTVQVVSLTINGKTVPVSTGSVSEYSGSRTARTAKSAAALIP